MWPTEPEVKYYRVLLGPLQDYYCVPIVIVEERAFSTEVGRWSDNHGIYAYEVHDWDPGVRRVYFENGLPPAYVERRQQWLRAREAAAFAAQMEAERIEAERRAAFLLLD